MKKVAENLGELLSGDSIESSPYELYMKKDEFCKVLCEVNLDKKDVEHFKNMVKEDYHHNWIIDNLPAATRYVRRGATSPMMGVCVPGV